MLSKRQHGGQDRVGSRGVWSNEVIYSANKNGREISREISVRFLEAPVFTGNDKETLVFQYEPEATARNIFFSETEKT